MVITCQKTKHPGAHSVTVKQVALDGFIHASLIQNIGGFCSKKCQDAFSSWRKRFSRLQPEQRESYFRPDSYYAKRPDPLQLSGETQQSGSTYRKPYRP